MPTPSAINPGQKYTSGREDPHVPSNTKKPVLRHDVQDHTRPPARPKKNRPLKLRNPLQHGISNFLTKHYQSHHSIDVNNLARTLPKRYTLYTPLLLLAPNVFTPTQEWQTFLCNLDQDDKQKLYSCIATAFGHLGVTHIAINAPIAVESSTSHGIADNVMRRPTGLLPIHGDFGPRTLFSDTKSHNITVGQPSKADFQTALWVQAVQNGGIVQIWAPMWTMFSRGNIREKARILDDTGGSAKTKFAGLDGLTGALGQRLEEICVVDLYVGIGYFAFSYLKRGAGLVWGWEINGWSVEGLRRGCEANGWECRVLRLDEAGDVFDAHGRQGDEALEGLVAELQSHVHHIRCVVFWGDNKFAQPLVARLQTISQKREKGQWKCVRHANLGLLPNSSAILENALKIMDKKKGGWLHIHENVDLKQIEVTRQELVTHIQVLVRAWHSPRQSGCDVSCCHIEQVKTYAPGVMHCVFDVHVSPTEDAESCLPDDYQFQSSGTQSDPSDSGDLSRSMAK